MLDHFKFGCQVFIITFVTIWLSVSFATLEIDPFAWESNTRGMMISVVVFITGLFTGIRMMD